MIYHACLSCMVHIQCICLVNAHGCSAVPSGLLAAALPDLGSRTSLKSTNPKTIDLVIISHIYIYIIIYIWYYIHIYVCVRVKADLQINITQKEYTWVLHGLRKMTFLVETHHFWGLEAQSLGMIIPDALRCTPGNVELIKGGPKP